METNKTILSKEEYINNHDLLSFTRFSKFLKCEASAAVGYRTPTTTSMLVGSYVDAYISEEFEEFRNEHPEIFNSRTGELKADFKKAEEIINIIKVDETMQQFLQGEKQKIMTGEICGVPFKIKMDVYNEGNYISDLKIMANFNKVWSDVQNKYCNFIEAYDYDIELAIFQEIVRQNTGKLLPCFIVSVTKEEVPDKGVFQFPQEDLDEALRIVRNRLPRIKKILNGEIEPERCEKCEYCKLTKKVKILSTRYVGFDGNQLREEGIDCNDSKIVIKNK